MDLGLTGRRAVVTGGSKGIGLEVAAELAAEGAAVAICSRNDAELAAAADAITTRTPDAIVWHWAADMTDPQQVPKFVAAAAAALGASTSW